MRLQRISLPIWFLRKKKNIDTDIKNRRTHAGSDKKKRFTHQVSVKEWGDSNAARACVRQRTSAMTHLSVETRRGGNGGRGSVCDGGDVGGFDKNKTHKFSFAAYSITQSADIVFYTRCVCEFECFSDASDTFCDGHALPMPAAIGIHILCMMSFVRFWLCRFCSVCCG